MSFLNGTGELATGGAGLRAGLRTLCFGGQSSSASFAKIFK